MCFNLERIISESQLPSTQNLDPHLFYDSKFKSALCKAFYKNVYMN